MNEDAISVRQESQNDRKARRWVRGGVIAASGVVLLTGLIGVLHLPFAAPVLRMVFRGAVCPITHGTPAQIDRAHAIGAAAIRSDASGPAPSRFALGFELDKTRRSDVDAWAKRNGIACKAIAGNENLQRCTDVPASAVQEASEMPALEEATFEFRSSGELVNVQTLRRRLTPDRAASIAGRLEQTAVKALGDPSSVAGVPSTAHLSHGVLSTFVVVHRFTDYRATVSATNLAPTGVMVREEYLSLR